MEWKKDFLDILCGYAADRGAKLIHQPRHGIVYCGSFIVDTDLVLVLELVLVVKCFEFAWVVVEVAEPAS